MKKLFLNANYVTAVSNIVSTATPNNHSSLEINQQISEFINSVQTEDFAELNKISEQIVDKKISATKLSEQISKEHFIKLLTKFIEKTKLKNQLTKEQKEKLIENINDQHLKLFQKNVKKIALDFKKETKKNKELTRKFKESLKTRITDEKNNYRVNIIDGEENSKQLIFELEELKKLIEINAKIKDDLLQELKVSEKYLNKLLIAQISLTATSIITGILSILLPALTIVTLGTGISSATISFIISDTNKRIEKIREKITRHTKLFSKPDEDKDFSSFKSVYGYTTLAVFGLRKSLVDLVIKVTSPGFFKLVSGINLIPKTYLLSTINIPFEIANLGFTWHDLSQSSERIQRINDFEVKLESLLLSLRSKYDLIEAVEWVVISETPQTDYYYNGGSGGKNLVFKNLKTNETKTIEEMLKIDPLTLKKWGMIKVFNPLLKDWYIRKLPNLTKKDNLG
ncbi:Uncharacterised protein [Mesomycoplasma dispar]|uniref:Uncharacterized protein n=1 Tax=Mesomycoplasma dispar TaxID=86660 RepID=A0AAJ5NS95_9BACT|nr:hypothetical protein [Mesomycoplasma dispar]AJR12566.1 hypothetical protein MDIS_02515 [Mesomycoplasma dispar]VEU61986.1 Uncharacterised protein [Mesomycoplasma dispar]